MCAAAAVQSVSERKMLMGRKAILNFIVYQSVTIQKDSGESGILSGLCESAAKLPYFS